MEFNQIKDILFVFFFVVFFYHLFKIIKLSKQLDSLSDVELKLYKIEGKLKIPENEKIDENRKKQIKHEAISSNYPEILDLFEIDMKRINKKEVKVDVYIVKAEKKEGINDEEKIQKL